MVVTLIILITLITCVNEPSIKPCLFSIVRLSSVWSSLLFPSHTLPLYLLLDNYGIYLYIQVPLRHRSCYMCYSPLLPRTPSIKTHPPPPLPPPPHQTKSNNPPLLLPPPNLLALRLLSLARPKRRDI